MAAPLLLAAVGAQAAGSLIQGFSEAKSFANLADQYIEQGLTNTKDFVRQQSADLAQGRAFRAASGVSVATGSALLVDENIVRSIAEGARRVQSEAAARAKEARKQAKAAKRGGILGAVGSLGGLL